MISRPTLLRLPDSRLAGLAATMLAHVALVAAWQQARKVQLPVQPAATFVQWVRVAPPLPPVRVPERAPGGGRPAPAPASRPIRSPDPTAFFPAIGAIAGTDVQAGPPPGLATGAAVATSRMIEQAIRDAGAAEGALRRQRQPTIVAAPDSPQLRLQHGIGEAYALAPNRWYEAPKVVELINDGGDGARRFRVVGAAGIYCVTERSPATSIDMIERHGKGRITNCGHEHEQPANAQDWRSARD